MGKLALIHAERTVYIYITVFSFKIYMFYLTNYLHNYSRNCVVRSSSYNMLWTGTSIGRKSNDLTEAELGSEMEECVSSLDKTSSWGDNAKHGPDSVENGVCNHHDCNMDHVHGQPFFK